MQGKILTAGWGLRNGPRKGGNRTGVPFALGLLARGAPGVPFGTALMGIRESRGLDGGNRTMGVSKTVALLG